MDDERPLPDPDEAARRAQATFVRRVAVVVAIAAAVALVIGLFPGYRVYENNNGDCFGYAIASFGLHGDPPRCERTERYVGTEAAGGPAFSAVLGVVLGIGALVWRWPRGWMLTLWAAGAWLAAVIAVAATFELDIFGETRREAMPAAMLLPVPSLLVFFGLPVAAVAAYAIRVRAHRRARVPQLPRAKVEAR